MGTLITCFGLYAFSCSIDDNVNVKPEKTGVAFVFAVLFAHTIEEETAVIGTLRSMGYST